MFLSTHTCLNTGDLSQDQTLLSHVSKIRASAENQHVQRGGLSEGMKDDIYIKQEKELRSSFHFYNTYRVTRTTDR